MATSAASQGYVPSSPPNTSDPELQRVIEWVRGELERITRYLNDLPLVKLNVQNVEPTKPRQGMLVYADGTNWNPGSGAGVYVRNASSWAKL